MRWIHLAAAAVLLAAVLSACGGKRAAVTFDPPPGAQLPALADYARAASIDDASQVRFGSEYDHAIPSARVIGDFDYPDTLVYFAGVGPPLSPAFAVYSFNLTGYDEAPLLKFHWDVQPNPGTVWVALSNWGSGRWEYISQDPAAVTLEDIAPYISPNGTLLLALIATDSMQHKLRWLAVGDAPAPGKPRVYDAYPRSSQPDSELTLSANVTGTLPLTYAWEFGGGATPDTSSEEKPTVMVGALGDYDAKLTLSNKYGSYEFPFKLHSVIPSWISHIVGDSLENAFVAMDATWLDHSLVAADMGDERVTMFHFDPDGNIGFSKAYSGLPANHATSVVLARPDFNCDATEIRDFYLTAYDDTEAISGAAYLMKCTGEGEVLWYQALGPGIPDLSRISDDYIAVSLVEPNGRTMAALVSQDGSVQWAVETGEPANYYCSSGADSIDGGIYLAGEVSGKAAIARINGDGTPAWAYEYPGNGTIRDCAYVWPMGLMVIGTFPQLPNQTWDCFFLTARQDSQLVGFGKFNTGTCRPVGLSVMSAVGVLTCSDIIGTKSQIYIMDPLGVFLKSIQIEGLVTMFGHASRMTRLRPFDTCEMNPGGGTSEHFVLVGASDSKDITVTQINQSSVYWRPTETPIPLSLQTVSLPSESLTILPEDVTYTVDGPAGGLDGLFVKIADAY